MNNFSRKHWFFLLLIPGLLILAVSYFLMQPDVPSPSSKSPVEALQGSTEGFLRAWGPREFQFPEDHGPHPGFRTEWWYYTGNLFTSEGRRFGYQFTLFRHQLEPEDSNEEPHRKHLPHNPSSTVPENLPSDWTTRQLYMAHLALSDVHEEKHYYEERFSREAAGLAGAQADPFKIWLEDWSVIWNEEACTPEHHCADADLPVHLSAANSQMSIELFLKPTKPIVLQGNDGYDEKGPEPGNASYYLSFTRLHTTGTLRIGKEDFRVSGYSWMDHEWSTSVLGESQTGWDWFSLQFQNGYDLMFYQLREDDTTISAYSTGTLVDPQGKVYRLATGDARLVEQSDWTSPVTGSVYPTQWRLSIPSAEVDLEIQTVFPNQEMSVSVTYYEGVIDATGTVAGQPASGIGFVEMTGR